MAARAERKKPMTQTKKSGGVNVQGDTMENIVMVRSGEDLFPHILLYTASPSPPPRRFFWGVGKSMVIHRLSVSVILQKRVCFSSSYLSEELIQRRSLACPFPESVATNLSS